MPVIGVGHSEIKEEHSKTRKHIIQCNKKQFGIFLKHFSFMIKD
jgi:hypothetical protein